MSGEVTLTGPANFWRQDTYKTVMEDLHAGADELGQIEQFNVSERTQVLTGALLSGISYIAHPNPDDKVLVEVFADVEPQLDEWGRIYDLYQEGGSAGFGTANMGLGLGSNNGSGNHEMFGRMFTDDIPAITEWGESMLSGSTDRLAHGNGVAL